MAQFDHARIIGNYLRFSSYIKKYSIPNTFLNIPKLSPFEIFQNIWICNP